MEKQLLAQDMNIKRYLIRFPQEEVLKAENEIVAEVNQHYSFEGFRKGKAPKALIKARMSESFDTWIKDYLVDLAMTDIEKEEKNLFDPMIEASSQNEGVIEIEVKIHAYPKILSTKFSDMQVEVVKKVQVVEKYVEDRLNQLLDQNAILDPKDGPAELEDFVRTTYSVINAEGKVITDKKESEYVLYKEDERPQVKEIVGKKAGETVTFERKFEEKSYTYTINILEVFKRTIPEISDDFVQGIGADVKSLVELKEKLTDEGSQAYENWKNDYIKNYIIGELANYVEVELSDETIDFYAQRYIDSLKKENKYEEELGKHENDEAKMLEEVKKSSVKWIKELAVVDSIVKQKDIKAEKEDIDSAITSLAQNVWYMQPERAREMVYSNQKLMNEIVWEVLRGKVAYEISSEVKLIEIDKDHDHEHDHEHEHNHE